MRTTYPYHIKAVQDALQKLQDRGDIYTQTYGGWYCVSEEIFFTEKDVHDGKCPNGHAVSHVAEKNYFFKMSKYQQPLIDYIHAHPDFILPTYRKNEVLGFLRQPLEDLCISRPKSRLSWGIELPFDKDYVTYVWFDALMNYATALGINQPAREKEFERIWPHALHLIGKDILTTHAVYWPTMLMAMNVPMPKTIFAHGWWLTEGNQKMSKSAGPVVKPLDMKNVVGVDPLRYFLARDISLGNDAQFSQDLVIARVNAELANNLGNLLSRSTNLVSKYFGDRVPPSTPSRESSRALAQSATAVAEKVRAEILALAPNVAIGHVVDLLNEANKYLEEMAPWKTAKTDLAVTGEVLYTALEVLRIAGILLQPVMPSKMSELLTRVGWPSAPAFDDAKKWGLLKEGAPVQKGEPLFPRVETKPA
jgi:methionyl-tRNA synthetase